MCAAESANANHREKERESATLQTSSDTSGKNLQTISMALSNLREQVKLKKAQIKGEYSGYIATHWHMH